MARAGEDGVGFNVGNNMSPVRGVSKPAKSESTRGVTASKNEETRNKTAKDTQQWSTNEARRTAIHSGPQYTHSKKEAKARKK